MLPCRLARLIGRVNQGSTLRIPSSACWLWHFRWSRRRILPSCRDELTRQALPNATVTAAERVGAGQYQMPDSPLTHIMSQPGMNVVAHIKQTPNPAFCVAANLAPSSDATIR